MAADIDFEELSRRLNDPALLILNVLKKEAYDEAHIPGSVHLPVDELRAGIGLIAPDRRREIVVYCGGPT
ncbi:MAG: rhodanese-like domain-containing protein [Candidatus Wallbacteria bacterium]|nr:rhodanese-like domain-containing protein [Candidatus Wallbacteria bacterium]